MSVRDSMRANFGLAPTKMPPPVQIGQHTFSFRPYLPEDKRWSTDRAFTLAGQSTRGALARELLTCILVRSIQVGDNEPEAPWQAFLPVAEQADPQLSAMMKAAGTLERRFDPPRLLAVAGAESLHEFLAKEQVGGLMEVLVQHLLDVIDPWSAVKGYTAYSCPCCSFEAVYETREAPYFCMQCGGSTTPEEGQPQAASRPMRAKVAMLESNGPFGPKTTQS